MNRYQYFNFPEYRNKANYIPKNNFKYNSYKSTPNNYSSSKIDNPKKENPIINILGINLYLDDILLLCLLFILYTENIKDDELFFTIILLLLT